MQKDMEENEIKGRKVAIDIENEPMPIPYYMIAAMMPCIVLGVIPTFIALLIGSLHLLALGIFFIASGSGDIWMTWLLTKENPKSMVLDHPSEAGFYIID